MALGRSTGREETTTGPARSKPGRRLSGWKEIGAFFGKNERTVKRWESRGLPVHRLPGATKAAVFAYPEELDAWLTGSRDLLAAEAIAQAQEDAEDAAPELPARVSPAPHVSMPAVLGAVALVIAVVGTLLVERPWNAADRPPQLAAATPRHQPAPGVRELYLSGIYHWNTRTADGL